MIDYLSFYKGKRVLLTGHTGFKGSWISTILIQAGAKVTGYSTSRQRDVSLFQLAGLQSRMNSVVGDVRDLVLLQQVFDDVQPQIVIHMAAQPIVRTGYAEPVYTYETNVMGTVNILECVRCHPCVRSFLNITTDKVYKNHEWPWGYRENEQLDGYDPYSNSKSCSELVTHCYRNSYFNEENDCAISTVRSGNVIGGGDFAKDRIIPDCVRAAVSNREIVVRNPFSTRPYQHVLEPVCAYLMIAAWQFKEKKYAGYYNVGPDDIDCLKTGNLVDLFVKMWGDGATWVDKSESGPHEATFLKLDNSKIKSIFGWKPHWQIEIAVEKCVEWYKTWHRGESIVNVMYKQIKEYMENR